TTVFTASVMRCWIHPGLKSPAPRRLSARSANRLLWWRTGLAYWLPANRVTMPSCRIPVLAWHQNGCYPRALFTAMTTAPAAARSWQWIGSNGFRYGNAVSPQTDCLPLHGDFTFRSKAVNSCEQQPVNRHKKSPQLRAF